MSYRKHAVDDFETNIVGPAVLGLEEDACPTSPFSIVRGMQKSCPSWLMYCALAIYTMQSATYGDAFSDANTMSLIRSAPILVILSLRFTALFIEEIQMQQFRQECLNFNFDVDVEYGLQYDTWIRRIAVTAWESWTLSRGFVLPKSDPGPTNTQSIDYENLFGRIWMGSCYPNALRTTSSTQPVRAGHEALASTHSTVAKMLGGIQSGLHFGAAALGSSLMANLTCRGRLIVTANVAHADVPTANNVQFREPTADDWRNKQPVWLYSAYINDRLRKTFGNEAARLTAQTAYRLIEKQTMKEHNGGQGPGKVTPSMLDTHPAIDWLRERSMERVKLVHNIGLKDTFDVVDRSQKALEGKATNYYWLLLGRTVG